MLTPSTCVIERLEVRALLSAGDLDLGFGMGGRASVALGGVLGGFVAVAPDGKVVTAARTGGRYETFIAVGRVTADGRPDPAFGGDGKVSIPTVLPPDDTSYVNDDSFSGLAVLPDGRIVLAGDCSDDVIDGAGNALTRRVTFLMRLRADGSPDPSFGGGDGIVTGAEGIVAVPSDAPASAFTGIAIRPDGRIVTARGASVYRFNADGTPDGSFGPGGAAVLPVPAGAGVFRAADVSLVPGASGDVVVVGALSPAAGGPANAFGLARLRPDGSPAPSFGGGDGFALEPLGDAAPAAFALPPQRLALGPDGSVALVGTNGAADRRRFAVARYAPDGSRDVAFGRGGADGDGVVSVGTPGLPWERGAADAAVQPDGKVLAVGNAGAPFSVVRLTTSGAPDATFAPGGGDGDGVMSVQFPPAPLWGEFSESRTPAFAVAIQPDGKVVAASGQLISDGWGTSGGVSLVRLHGDATGGQSRTYEAERAQASGALVAASHPGFGGTGYVDYVSASRDSVEFAVDAPTAGTYALAFRYANGGLSARAMGLSANGAAVADGVSFAPSGSWRTWTTAAAAATLAAGRNRVVLTATGRSGPNLDALAVQLVPPPAPLVYEAENAGVSGPAVARDHSGYTGTGYADFRNAADDLVSFPIHVTVAGAYALDSRYANGGTADRPLALSVDERVSGAPLSFAPTGSWRAWRTETRVVLLAPGPHWLQLNAVGRGGPNLDALTVRAAAGW